MGECICWCILQRRNRSWGRRRGGWKLLQCNASDTLKFSFMASLLSSFDAVSHKRGQFARQHQKSEFIPEIPDFHTFYHKNSALCELDPLCLRTENGRFAPEVEKELACGQFFFHVHECWIALQVNGLTQLYTRHLLHFLPHPLKLDNVDALHA